MTTDQILMLGMGLIGILNLWLIRAVNTAQTERLKLEAELALIRTELMTHRIESAEKYVTATLMREVEERVRGDITKIGDRVDKLLTNLTRRD